MTQSERAQVWARKDQLTAIRRPIPATEENEEEITRLTTLIEQCNQALIQDRYEIMPSERDGEEE